ncbi:hypothetical protein Taro_020962, partial [Colocasia esculenta]|nr:hypothetical protein [Colocasia esculenta]
WYPQTSRLPRGERSQEATSTPSLPLPCLPRHSLPSTAAAVPPFSTSARRKPPPEPPRPLSSPLLLGVPHRSAAASLLCRRLPRALPAPPRPRVPLPSQHLLPPIAHAAAVPPYIREPLLGLHDPTFPFPCLSSPSPTTPTIRCEPASRLQDPSPAHDHITATRSALPFWSRRRPASSWAAPARSAPAPPVEAPSTEPAATDAERRPSASHGAPPTPTSFRRTLPHGPPRTLCSRPSQFYFPLNLPTVQSDVKPGRQRRRQLPRRPLLEGAAAAAAVASGDTGGWGRRAPRRPWEKAEAAGPCEELAVSGEPSATVNHTLDDIKNMTNYGWKQRALDEFKIMKKYGLKEGRFQTICENEDLDIYTKRAVLKASAAVVSLVSYLDEKKIFHGSGTIIESDDKSGIILTSASLIGCPMSENIVTDNVKIQSNAPLPIASLRRLDDSITVDLNELGILEEKAFQLRSHSNSFNLIPGDTVIALGRYFIRSYEIMVAPGGFSVVVGVRLSTVLERSLGSQFTMTFLLLLYQSMWHANGGSITRKISMFQIFLLFAWLIIYCVVTFCMCYFSL